MNDAAKSASRQSARPPLPRALKLVLIAGTAIFLSPLMLLLPLEQPLATRIMGGWGVAWLLVVLASAFHLLREGFSARPDRKPARAAKAHPNSSEQSDDPADDQSTPS